MVIVVLGLVRMGRMLVRNRRFRAVDVYLSILQAVLASRRKPAAGFLVPTVTIPTVSVPVLVLARKSSTAEGRKRSRIEIGTIRFYIAKSASVWECCLVDRWT